MIRFSKTHEWIDTDEDGLCRVGISAYAAGELGDVVYVSLPETGASVTAGEPFCEVESVKAVSEVLSPVDGVIVEVNSSLEDAPEQLNADPEAVWICRIEATRIPDDLMSREEYEADKK